MRRAIIPALLLVLVSVVLGATVFRERVAHAAATLMVREQNTDANRNIKVHEQGTADVRVTGGAVDVGSTPVATELRQDTNTGLGTHVCFSNSPIVASSLALSAIGNSASFEFRAGGACDQNGNYEGGHTVFALDVATDTSLSIPLHDRLLVNDATVDCGGFNISCTWSYALVGQAP
jgi:hypothetical protein